jgi:signal transduction histidine kinase
MNGNVSFCESNLYTVGKLTQVFPPANGAGQESSLIASVICRAVGAALGCVLFSTEDTEKLVGDVLWCDTLPDTIDITLCSSSTKGMLGRAFQEQQVQLIDYPNIEDELFQFFPQEILKQLGSSMLAPVLSRERVAGAIFVGRLKSQNPFAPSDAVYLATLASILSLGFSSNSLQQRIEALSNKLSRVDAQLLQSAKLAATGKLAASIAHEINNPLQSVQSCIYLVADSMTDNGPNKQYLDIAREELERIAKIVQRLADLYRPSQEGQRKTDLNALLENVLALMSKRLQQSNVQVRRSLDSDLPHIMVMSDQIKQVSFNLILNAVEAMPEGGSLDIKTSLVREPSGSYVEISFRDSGVGIAPEAIERIFDPFYTTKAKGTGLGLSISHDIVERHGGSLHVESQVGSGTVFTARLPGCEE